MATGGTSSTGAAAKSGPGVTYTERVVLAAGFSEDYKLHGNVVFIDEKEEKSVLTDIPLCANASHVSVCAAPYGFIASGGWSNLTKRSMSLVQRFNLVTRSWFDLPDMPHPRENHGSICANNRFFTSGGVYDENGAIKFRHATVSVLDLNASKWVDLVEPLQTAVSKPGVAVVDTVLMVVGGYDGTTDSTQACIYDTRTLERGMCPPMPKPCQPFNRTVAAGTSIYVLHEDSTLFMQYDLQTKQWTELPCPVKPVWWSAMVLHNNRILVTGGSITESLNGPPTDRTQSYNGTKWVMEKPTMPLKLVTHAAFVLRMPVRQ